MFNNMHYLVIKRQHCLLAMAPQQPEHIGINRQSHALLSYLCKQLGHEPLHRSLQCWVME
jgi:hypothetical protein